jgi:hypothetical protein
MVPSAWVLVSFIAKVLLPSYTVATHSSLKDPSFASAFMAIRSTSIEVAYLDYTIEAAC